MLAWEGLLPAAAALPTQVCNPRINETDQHSRLINKAHIKKAIASAETSKCLGSHLETTNSYIKIT